MEDTKLVSKSANHDEQETVSLPPSLRDSTNGAPLLTLSGRPNTCRASGPLLDNITVRWITVAGSPPLFLKFLHRRCLSYKETKQGMY